MKIVPIAVLTLLAGCTVSPVKPLEGGVYSVTASNYTSLSTGSHEVVRATDKANLYCAQSGKVAKVQNSVGAGIPALTGISGTIMFRCVTP